MEVLAVQKQVTYDTNLSSSQQDIWLDHKSFQNRQKVLQLVLLTNAHNSESRGNLGDP